MISGKNLYRNEWALPIFFVPIVVAASLWFAQNYAVGAIIVLLAFLLAISWLVSRFGLQNLLLMILSVLLPFSFEIPVSDNLNINFPSEPMLAIAIFSIGWDILRKPGLLKQFMNNENGWTWPLLLSFIIATLFSTIPWVSIKFSVVNVTYILVFFIWQKYLFRVHPNLFPRLIGLYSISLFAVLVYAVFQFQYFGWNPVTIRGVFQPFYKDNTIFGATSALLASFWIAYTSRAETLLSKMMYLFLGLVFLAGVVLSTSRAAALSLIFFGIVWIILQLRIRLKYIVLGVTLVFMTVMVFRNPIYRFLMENKHLSHNSQFGYLEQLESSGNVSSDISNIERMNRWVAGFGMFSEKPLIGFGPGTYQFVYIPYQKKEFMSRLTVKDSWHIPENSGGTAHSEYVLAISEMGILGIAALLILFGRWIWIAFVKARNHPQRTSIMIGFAVISTYLFHAFFNNFLSTDKFAFLFWGVAAWMVSHFELKTNEQH